MSTDCPDICDKLLEVMCIQCLNYNACQNSDTEPNHDQMMICLDGMVLVRHPDMFTSVQDAQTFAWQESGIEYPESEYPRNSRKVSTKDMHMQIAAKPDRFGVELLGE
jgi:hypothetical protein